MSIYLMTRALASMASTGDIYTEAWECRGSVVAAQNLSILARLLSSGTEIVAEGKLIANHAIAAGAVSAGAAVIEVDAHVRADCTLLVTLPEDFEVEEVSWTLLIGDATYEVDLYAGESADDDTFIVRDAEAFYVNLIKDDKKV